MCSELYVNLTCSIDKNHCFGRYFHRHLVENIMLPATLPTNNSNDIDIISIISTNGMHYGYGNNGILLIRTKK